LEERCSVYHSLLITLSQKKTKYWNKTAAEYNLHSQMKLSSYIQSILYFLTASDFFIYMQSEHWNALRTQIVIRKAACLAVSKEANMTIKHGKSRWKIYFRMWSNNREIREQLKQGKNQFSWKSESKVISVQSNYVFFLNQGLC
jgi:hypothetical protein